MLILTDASNIIFSAISPGTSSRGSKLDIAYLEFTTGPAVTPPEIDPETSAAYYAGLAASPDRDYLRCPVMSHTLGRTPAGKPKLTVQIVSDGEIGVHGKPFSAGAKIYGIALASAKSDNPEEDLFFGRHYYETTAQIEKPSSGGVMVSFDLLLS